MITAQEINGIRDKFNSYKAECEIFLSLIEEKENKIKDLSNFYEDLLQVRYIITEVGKHTQEKLKDYIETMVSTALQAVFEKNYEFKINFNIKRNRPEAELKIKFNDIELDPKDELGGGGLDVASFGLRIVFWTLQKNRTSKVIFLDEPFRFLHGNLEQAGKMLKDISSKLGLQIIIITQFDELNEVADKIFECKHNGQFSEVKEIICLS